MDGHLHTKIMESSTDLTIVERPVCNMALTSDKESNYGKPEYTVPGNLVPVNLDIWWSQIRTK